MRDRIDEQVERWQRELPELEPRVEAITARMHLLVRFLRQGRQRALAGQTLQWWEYKTLLELRRRGKPYRATPKELAAALGLSPAGVTKRLTRSSGRVMSPEVTTPATAASSTSP